MSRSPRIAIVTSSLALGGSEVQVVMLSRGLKSAGWEVVVVALQPGPLAADLHADKIRVIDLPMGRLTTPSTWLKLRRALNDLAPDIVHTQAFRANLWGRLAGLAPQRNVVASVRATYTYLPSAYYPVERLLSRWTAAIVTPSQATADHLAKSVKIRKKLISVIPNAVDTTLFMPNGTEKSLRREWGDGSFVVLAPGRLVAQKNHRAIINAFQLVAEKHPDAVLVIAGTGPLEGALRRQASHLQYRVVFTGELSRGQMVRAMGAADTACLASRFEGMPNVLLEAMASAKPVVASAVDGVQEIVEDGKTGFLTPPGDDFALAEALVRLAGDPSLRAGMGAAGRQRMMARHSPGLNVQRHMSVYEEILQRQPEVSIR